MSDARNQMAGSEVARYREGKRRGERVAVLTAYDYPTARLLDEAGIDILLVGDSLGMVMLGYEDTTFVTMEEMEHHTRAVRRGTKRALVVSDLPYASYETPESALGNAKRLLAAGADAVKLEGGVLMEGQIAAITAAGIPFMGHIGMSPQNVRNEGGYSVKGKTDEEAARIMADAAAVQRAGAFSVVLELVQPDVARQISRTLEIPTIGIAAGAGCDGQVLVSHDLFGTFPWFTPRHVKWQGRAGEEIRLAAKRFITETKASAS
jgi:3-methyl-2-oxobutanoate hydroxymethyltransferase